MAARPAMLPPPRRGKRLGAARGRRGESGTGIEHSRDFPLCTAIDTPYASPTRTEGSTSFWARMVGCESAMGGRGPGWQISPWETRRCGCRNHGDRPAAPPPLPGAPCSGLPRCSTPRGRLPGCTLLRTAPPPHARRRLPVGKLLLFRHWRPPRILISAQTQPGREHSWSMRHSPLRPLFIWPPRLYRPPRAPFLFHSSRRHPTAPRHLLKSANLPRRRPSLVGWAPLLLPGQNAPTVACKPLAYSFFCARHC